MCRKDALLFSLFTFTQLLISKFEQEMFVNVLKLHSKLHNSESNLNLPVNDLYNQRVTVLELNLLIYNLLNQNLPNYNYSD